MERRYHIIEKENTEAVRGFLSKSGQALLPLVEQIEQGEVALDELIVPPGAGWRRPFLSGLRRLRHRRLARRAEPIQKEQW